MLTQRVDWVAWASIQFYDARDAIDDACTTSSGGTGRRPRGVGQDHVRRHFAELALRNQYNFSFIGFVLYLSSEEEYRGFDDFYYYSNNRATV